MTIKESLGIILKIVYPLAKKLLLSGRHFEIAIQGKHSKLIKIEHVLVKNSKIEGEIHYEQK